MSFIAPAIDAGKFGTLRLQQWLRPELIRARSVETSPSLYSSQMRRDLIHSRWETLIH